MIKRYLTISFGIIIIILIIFIGYREFIDKPSEIFSGNKALEDVKYQVDLGPRTLGSEAHTRVVDWIIAELKAQNWQVETQETEIFSQNITNVIAKRGEGTPWIILGSHYDSRPSADRDPDPSNRVKPVPGANDGASSTAILLELARVIPRRIDGQVWLVFFDAEDTGTSSGPGWANGSEYFVSNLEGKPDQVIVLDMVGDKELNIFMEGNSNRELNSKFWALANELGYSQFRPIYKYDIIDDHIPFIKAGIPAIDVIDMDYPFWHTTSDTVDKVSAQSLEIVGITVQKWLEQYAMNKNSTN
jgi:Zn-dependent M28 family amino/carboxypeptidase